MFTTGDKLLNVMKEEEISIAELAKISGVPEHTILEILAGIREPELNVMCKIVEGLGICVHELCGDEEKYACLENPMDGGAWWAVFHGVARVRHD